MCAFILVMTMILVENDDSWPGLVASILSSSFLFEFGDAACS